MSHTTRRLLTGAVLVLAAGAGAVAAPVAAAAAGSTATVDVNSELKARSAPRLTASVVGTLTDGQKIAVDCAVTGQGVRGKVRTTTQWDRLVDGRYVSHAYVRTAAVIRPCGTQAGATAAVTGKVRTGDGPVNVRSGPSSAHAVVRKATDGAAVKIACAVPGAKVKGTVRTSTQWDRLTDGRYISHAYVISGAVKACPPSAPAPTAPAPAPTAPAPAPTAPAPAPTAPAPVLTPDQFIAAAVPGAQKGWRQYGVPASVTIAQAILESGWGRSGLSSVDRNYFGIKCQNGYYGTHANGCHVYTTTECDKAGKCFQIRDAFRTYASMARSFADHGHFLKTNKRYAPAFAHTRDADKFIEQVWKAGYATDPKYVAKVTGIMTNCDLYRYDTWK
ncbi:sporangiospore maturation cell wall hydrolase GsmA [Actinoplanes sp. NEAU-A12]|uniref:Sporangiospore maturation cell wall hydrolase GsmA n=1 Tax=Actinoplanes sandaracinus TaxID=3045177 RepID=A0ABT6WN41_9ACTN|nr:sporangiospore maturation cell wall hydrolase GsmA [Actinoplanes sandaracinus]MDI6101154.1 sporangiospore maturation cell wall hydrolase GsmA [Actinoplanes sandaracinus]